MGEEKTFSDRDLLIRLDERMGSMKEAHQKMDEKLERVFTLLKDKADKKDIDHLLSKIDDHESRLLLLEENKRDTETKSKTIWSIIRGSWHVWAGFSGVVLFFISVIGFLASLF